MRQSRLSEYRAAYVQVIDSQSGAAPSTSAPPPRPDRSLILGSFITPCLLCLRTSGFLSLLSNLCISFEAERLPNSSCDTFGALDPLLIFIIYQNNKTLLAKSLLLFSFLLYFSQFNISWTHQIPAGPLLLIIRLGTSLSSSSPPPPRPCPFASAQPPSCKLLL